MRGSASRTGRLYLVAWADGTRTEIDWWRRSLEMAVGAILSVSLPKVPMMHGPLSWSVVRMGKVKTPIVPLVTNSSWLERVPVSLRVLRTEGGVPLARVL